MPPTSYTEAELKTFIVTVLSDVATILGWTTATAQVTEALNEALFAYDVADIAGATNIRRLRALTRVEAWRAAAEALASRFDRTADGVTADLEKLHAHALLMLASAERAAAALDEDGDGLPGITTARSGAVPNRAVW